MTEIALFYKNVLGINVVPQKDKRALVPWIELQTRRATDEEVTKWFTENKNAGISGVVGTISRVVVIDCDSPEAISEMELAIPDNIVVPCVQTPRGGRHYYFSCTEKMQKIVGFMEKMDLQAEASTIVMPPSKGKNGTPYQWIVKPESHQDFPAIAVIKSSGIYSNITKKRSLYIEDCNKPVINSLQDITDITPSYIFEKGHRDDNLFHIALDLIKSGNSEEYVKQVLTTITASWGEHDEKWIEDKIQSAVKRKEGKDRNLKAEVEDWILLQEGYFYLTETLQTLQIITKEEKNNFHVIINRLVGKTIEKHGERRGCYRRIERNANKTKFIQGKIEDFPIHLPFDLNDYVKLYPKSVMVIAGTKGAGKTALALKIALENGGNIPVRYMHSEGGDEEFSERMQSWGIIDEEEISFEALKVSRNFHDYVTNERKIFIIDFLEIHDEFYQVAALLKKIHDKLLDGIAIVCIQKKMGALFGRGDEFSQEVARLYLNMDYIADETCTKITIVSAKAPKVDENLTGWWRKIKITRKGTKLQTIDNCWNHAIASDPKPRRTYGAYNPK